MLRSILALTAVACLPLHATAQEGTPPLNTDPPEGPELVAVFLSSSTCRANIRPGFLDAVRKMNGSLKERAAERGIRLVTIGIATDWYPDSGFAYLRGLSTFDEVVVGRNWYNMGVARYIWADSTATPLEPQVILLEREVTLLPPSGVIISDGRVVRRILGGDDITAWVEEGTPLLDLQAPATPGPLPAQHPDTAAYAGGNGSDCDHAVVIKVTEHLAVVHAERRWLAWRYPGGEVRRQAVLMRGDRAFDSIRYQTTDGEVIDCFDVTESILAGGGE
jgi:hypothetical protein